MPERSVVEAYEIILDALREHRLSWVAEQIQDQVRAGKPTTRLVAPTPAPTSDRYAEEFSQTRRQRSERLAATEPYTPMERLTLALEALQRAVIHTADIEDDILKFFHLEGKASARIIFEPEEFEEAKRIEFGSLPSIRWEAVARLGQAVDVLRREVERGDHRRIAKCGHGSSWDRRAPDTIKRLFCV